MPIYPEQRARFDVNRAELRGTWWYHLAAPGEPVLYVVAEVPPEGPLQLRRLRWEGDRWDIQDEEPSIPLDSAILLGDFSSFWYLGSSWLGVYLNPGMEIINDEEDEGRIETIFDEGLNVEMFVGVVRHYLNVYDLLQEWRPLIQARVGTGSEELVPHLLPKKPSTKPPPVEEVVWRRSRFERLINDA